METTFQLRLAELDADFLESVRRLFSKERELRITISPVSDFDLNAPESEAAYWERLSLAAAQVEAGRKTISLSEAELDQLAIKE